MRNSLSLEFSPLVVKMFFTTFKNFFVVLGFRKCDDDYLSVDFFRFVLFVVHTASQIHRFMPLAKSMNSLASIFQPLFQSPPPPVSA